MALLGVADFSLLTWKHEAAFRFVVWLHKTLFIKAWKSVSESCSVEQTSNWNVNKIDPCYFVLRVVWGSALYEELRSGIGAQGGVCVNWQALLGEVWNLGTADNHCMEWSLVQTLVADQIKAVLKEPHKVCATERKFYRLL